MWRQQDLHEPDLRWSGPNVPSHEVPWKHPPSRGQTSGVQHKWGELLLVLYQSAECFSRVEDGIRDLNKWSSYCFPRFRNVPISTPVSVTRAGVVSTARCQLPGPPLPRHACHPPDPPRPSREPRPRRRSPPSPTRMCVSIPLSATVCHTSEIIIVGNRHRNWIFLWDCIIEFSHTNVKRHFSTFILKLLLAFLFHQTKGKKTSITKI